MGNFIIFWAHGVTHMRFDFLDKHDKKNSFSPPTKGKNFTFERPLESRSKPQNRSGGKKGFFEMRTKSHLTKKKSPKKVKNF